MKQRTIGLLAFSLLALVGVYGLVARRKGPCDGAKNELVCRADYVSALKTKRKCKERWCPTEADWQIEHCEEELAKCEVACDEGAPECIAECGIKETTCSAIYENKENCEADCQNNYEKKIQEFDKKYR